LRICSSSVEIMEESIGSLMAVSNCESGHHIIGQSV